MKTYHKIQSIFKRDPDNRYRTFIDGAWSVDAFGLLKDLEWTFTEKIDGTNIRIGWDNVKRGILFGGRSDNADIPGQLTNYMKEHFTFERMERLSGPVTLIGEGYGGKIQKGSRYQAEQGFILFDVYVEPYEEHPLGIFLERNVVEEIATLLDIPVVPIVHKGPLLDGIHLCRDCKVFMSLVAVDKELPAEGIVARPSVELFDRLGRRVITKIKVKDFQ